ncbi:glutathione S-transferase family protein [Ferrimonas aestuarii]|uniref:Glutathione S-transferase family protein n=2 Tax=Ferrimonas aestuarii TaxID=2569539 RepID=A0A4U1BEA1_9GAMM|nr:glutathione S-transferase family protein [Ferrimonas aestuarii]
MMTKLTRCAAAITGAASVLLSFGCAQNVPQLQSSIELNPDLPPIVLHHTQYSPFAEKARIMLGYTQLKWYAVNAPLPPRPIQEELVGGYARRIPLLQIGADIFVDSDLIAKEIAALSHQPELDRSQQSTRSQQLVTSQEPELFLPILNSMSKLQFLSGLHHMMPFGQMVRFTRDRLGAFSDFEQPTMDRALAQLKLEQKNRELADALQGGPYLFGQSAPTIADFSAFHLRWYRASLDYPVITEQQPELMDWYQRMDAIDHGQRTDIEPKLAWTIASTYSPRPIPESMTLSDRIGKTISLKPNDTVGYATPAIEGILVGENQQRYVIRRQTTHAGIVHIYFPKQAYGACF